MGYELFLNQNLGHGSMKFENYWFRMNHKEIEKVCTLVQGEMLPVGRESTDLSLKDKTLLCSKTPGSCSFQSCSKTLWVEPIGFALLRSDFL